MRTTAAACLILLLATPAARSLQDTQAPPQQASPTLRITVTLVQVDAVVTDSSGRHVTDLRPADFEILQDGEVQKITHFTYVPAPAPVPAAVTEPKSKDSAGAPPFGPPQPITAGEVKRTVALVVDDMALSFQNLVRVREGLRKYVTQQMQPGDLVALVRTGGGVALLEQFTTDKRILLEGIDLLKWRFSGRAGVLPIEPLPGSTPGAARTTPQMLDYDSSVSALGALGTLEQVVSGMKSRPGRKSVIFFSDSLRVDARINNALDRLTDLSNRSAVSLYTVDPSGLKVHQNDASGGTAVFTEDPGATMGFPPIFGGEDEFRQQEGLQALASRSGGIFYKNNNDIPDLIRKATDDQLGYYLLGYSPKEGTFEPLPGKARFHRVQVRVLRRGLEVRWKSGFNGVTDESLVTSSTGPRTREEQLLDALTSPFPVAGLKVRLTSLFDQTKRDGPFIHSLLYFGGQDLSFHHEDDGSWKASVEILTLAYRGLKQPFQQRFRHHDIQLPASEYAKAQKEGFLFVLDDRVKQPGTFVMRAVVRDTVSERIGSASQFIQVPDTRKGQLALSGIILQTNSNQPVTVPPDGNPSNDGKVQAWTEGGPAVRRYRPGLGILFGYEVINPKFKGPAKKEINISSLVRVYYNGHLFFTGKPLKNVEQSKEDPNRYLGGGLLRLGDTLTPGEYLLQVVVTDGWAKKKNSQVAQWIDFEVVPESNPETRASAPAKP